jgi:hypothetical protein
MAGFVKQSNRMPKPSRSKGGIPSASNWVGKPVTKGKHPVGARAATTHTEPGPTSPVQAKQKGC